MDLQDHAKENVREKISEEFLDIIHDNLKTIKALKTENKKLKSENLGLKKENSKGREKK
jgi:hypothetical protein